MWFCNYSLDYLAETNREITKNMVYMMMMNNIQLVIETSLNIRGFYYYWNSNNKFIEYQTLIPCIFKDWLKIRKLMTNMVLYNDDE